MEASGASLWGGLAAIAVVLLAVLVTIYAVTALCNLVARTRDDLRGRYFTQRLMLRWYNLVAVPVWIALELACFVCTALLTLLIVWIAYDTARGFRDWWHQDTRDER